MHDEETNGMDGRFDTLPGIPPAQTGEPSLVPVSPATRSCSLHSTLPIAAETAASTAAPPPARGATAMAASVEHTIHPQRECRHTNRRAEPSAGLLDVVALAIRATRHEPMRDGAHQEDAFFLVEESFPLLEVILSPLFHPREPQLWCLFVLGQAVSPRELPRGEDARLPRCVEPFPSHSHLIWPLGSLAFPSPRSASASMTASTRLSTTPSNPRTSW